MIEARPIHQLEHSADSINPPLVARFRQYAPAIERIPPQLSRRAEVIRRHARNRPRRTVRIEIKDFRICPYIGAVVRDKDGYIADDLYASAVAVALQVAPLPEELILDELVSLHVGRIRIGSLFPFRPGNSAIRVFQRHELSEAGQPALPLRAKRFEVAALRLAGVPEKGASRPLEETALERNDGAEVYNRLRKLRRSLQLGALDPSLLREPVKADKERIACHAREALVGRIPIPRRAEGEYLPEALPVVGEKIGEPVRALPQVPDSMRPGKRSGMKQNAAQPLHRYPLATMEVQRDRRRNQIKKPITSTTASALNALSA